MNLTLGMSGRDAFKTLSRWGSELRALFFLSDKDIGWNPWDFSLDQISTATAGVTFSNLQIFVARYLHVGQLCLWELTFFIQGSGDYDDLAFPMPPVPRDWNGNSDCRTPAASGLLIPVRGAAFGAVSIRVPPCMVWENVNSDNMRISPALFPAVNFYTAAGTAQTQIYLEGFYFTKDLPLR